jgi:hypothetical protein
MVDELKLNFGCPKGSLPCRKARDPAFVIGFAWSGQCVIQGDILAVVLALVKGPNAAPARRRHDGRRGLPAWRGLPTSLTMAVVVGLAGAGTGSGLPVVWPARRLARPSPGRRWRFELVSELSRSDHSSVRFCVTSVRRCPCSIIPIA